MSDNNSYRPSPNFSSNAFVNEKQYTDMYARSLRDPKNFWSEQADKFVTWFKRWDEVVCGDFTKLNVQWFKGGRLNACYNLLDRHLEKRSKQVALIWESNAGDEVKKITYAELFEQVCRFTNVLKKLSVKKGDRVCIYLPMIPEAVVAMLACARIGAVHSVVFAGFSPESLNNRIKDSSSQIVITADEGYRGDKIIPLKNNVDEAIKLCPKVRHVVVVKRTGNEIAWNAKKDIWYQDAMQEVSNKPIPCEMLDAQDPLFILYTSGSTGAPKGIVHSIGGYLVFAAMTFKYIFDYHENEVFWCAADIGWITGHTYTIYGPLCNGATILMYEGIPNYPDPSRIWQIVDKHQVNVLYTAPTALRALRREGDKWVTKASRQSLRLLGSVGEPINPDVWEWYFNVVGEGRCPIVDTWWQTETGGIMISPLPGATTLKPGSATVPFFGVVAKVVDDKGQEVPAGVMGNLVITEPWPGMMETIFGNRERFETSYFKQFPGKYLTGDSAKQDAEGYFWITGRNDDVLKISGHRIGTEEVESALLQHPSVSEAAVVAISDEIKGEDIYAFVVLKNKIKGTKTLQKELINQVRKSIGAIATPKIIQWTNALPKTRSGKIMRRVLRKIANNDIADLGDTSTLADQDVVDDLIKGQVDLQHT